MSLKRVIEGASQPPMDSTSDGTRMHELFRIMTEVGLSRMSTQELEEWTYLMAQSLEGKGDPFVPIEKAHTILTEGPGSTV
jgi:hypothetical protein